jgi:hypothetical protein
VLLAGTSLGTPPAHIRAIRMEPTFPGWPEHSWAVDILLKSPRGTGVAFCEVKRDDHELNELICGFRHCCKAGSHPKNECKFRKNHPKYASCVDIKPDYFMAVSPGREFRCCRTLDTLLQSLAYHYLRWCPNCIHQYKPTDGMQLQTDRLPAVE